MTENPKEAARRLARGGIPGDFTPEALHTYTDETGKPLYWRIRARLANGDKWIRPMRMKGHGFELGEPDFTEGKPLYRLHELAAKPGAPVWYVEGENCADALARLGVLATTAGSASSDERANFAPLAARAVTLWPDNDTSGIEHTERVATKAQALGCNVESVDARALGLSDGGDCVDWLRALPDATARDLAKLPRLRNRPMPTTSDRRAKFTLTPIGELLAEPQETIRWLVDGLLPAGGISVLAARPKAGKSTLARELAVRVACGGQFLGRATTTGAVFILDLEGKRGESINALRRMGVTAADPIKVFFGTAPEGALDDLRAAALAEHPALIEVDTMQRLARVPDLNDYARVTLALDPFIALARDAGAHVMLLHHQGRGGRGGVDSPMGSTAIAGSVDTILTMRRCKDDTRTLSSVQRYGTDMDETVLTLDSTGHLATAGLAREHEQREAEGRILHFLTEHAGADQAEVREGVEGRWAVVRAALTALLKVDKLSRTGSGKKGDPFQYVISGSAGSLEPWEPENQHLGSHLPPSLGGQPRIVEVEI